MLFSVTRLLRHCARGSWHFRPLPRRPNPLLSSHSDSSRGRRVGVGGQKRIWTSPPHQGVCPAPLSPPADKLDLLSRGGRGRPEVSPSQTRLRRSPGGSEVVLPRTASAKLPRTMRRTVGKNHLLGCRGARVAVGAGPSPEEALYGEWRGWSGASLWRMVCASTSPIEGR